MHKEGRKYKRNYDIVAKRHKLCHRKRAFRNDRQGIIVGDGRMPDTKRRGPFTLGGVRLLHAFLRKPFYKALRGCSTFMVKVASFREDFL